MNVPAASSAPIDALDPLDPPHVVAAGLSVSIQTLANWRCTKRVALPYVKIGRSVRYRRSEWQRLSTTGELAA
jgi:hypothetical protein